MMYNLQNNLLLTEGSQMALEELSQLELHSITDTFNFVKENALRMYHINTNSMSLYRGQSNYAWHLEPAVYRNNQFPYESLYIKELERKNPSEFVNQSNFDKLVKMQHYGLPTRLLDVTFNPLVALYFACENHFDTDGAFYYFSTPTFWEDNWAIQIVTDYIMEPTNYVDELIEQEFYRLPSVFQNPNDAKSTILHTLAVPAHAILPKYTNQRIQQQSGAFLLFGMSLQKPETTSDSKDYSPNYLSYGKLDKNQQDKICPVIKKIRIPAKYKQNILHELDLLNINESFLFPELEHQSKTVVQYISQNLNPYK